MVREQEAGHTHTRQKTFTEVLPGIGKIAGDVRSRWKKFVTEHFTNGRSN